MEKKIFGYIRVSTKDQKVASLSGAFLLFRTFWERGSGVRRRRPPFPLASRWGSLVGFASLGPLLTV